MAERILLGHFLTRTQAAHRASIQSSEVVQRPDLLRIGGTWLEEVYFAFQFDRIGVRHDIGVIVQQLRRRFDDETIADWLVRPNALLSSATPLDWARAGGDDTRLVRASTAAGPLVSSQGQYEDAIASTGSGVRH